MRWSQSPQNATHGPLVRSVSIARTILPLFVMAVQPHWSSTHHRRIPPHTSPYGRWQQPEPAISGYSAQNGHCPLKDQAHKNHLQRSHTRCGGLLCRLNHTGSGLRISGQFPKRGVNLRHCPLTQWLSCTARTNRIRQIQCGTALCTPQAQNARTSRGYNN